MTFNTSTNQVSTTGYSYDTGGNTTQDGPLSNPAACQYTWDAEGRVNTVAHCASLSFTYNALGQRVLKNVSNGSNYIYSYYDPFGTLAFIRNNPYVLGDFFPPVAGRNYGKYGDSVTYFLHTNLVGSTGAVSDQTGATLQDQLYYPWGQQWSSAGTLKDVRFASLKERDSETGLDPTYFRMYSSNVGRWLSRDPMRGVPCKPQSRDLYAYVQNNPVRFIDPTGRNLANPGLTGGGYCDPYFGDMGGCSSDPLGGGGGGGDPFGGKPPNPDKCDPAFTEIRCPMCKAGCQINAFVKAAYCGAMDVLPSIFDTNPFSAVGWVGAAAGAVIDIVTSNCSDSVGAEYVGCLADCARGDCSCDSGVFMPA